MLVWFDPASPPFSVEVLNAPNRYYQTNKPAEGFIGEIQGALLFWLELSGALCPACSLTC